MIICTNSQKLHKQTTWKIVRIIAAKLKPARIKNCHYNSENNTAATLVQIFEFNKIETITSGF